MRLITDVGISRMRLLPSDRAEDVPLSSDRYGCECLVTR
jgi:hypothetical protein